MNAVILKQTWDKWIEDVAAMLNLWSSAAAQPLSDAFTEARRRHAQWELSPYAEKLKFEDKFVYGRSQQLPPVAEKLEGHMGKE
eukprot:2632316-Amphidinium_carterae.1